MNLYVHPTDQKWFDHLARMSAVEDVNFWRPSARGAFRALQPGELFLFKLKNPSVLAGGGFFTRYERATIEWAWDAFGEGNGASTLDQLRARIQGYKRSSDPYPDEIGCILLSEAFFLSPDQWIPCPPEYSLFAERGMHFAVEDEVGRHLYEAIAGRLAQRTPTAPAQQSVVEGARYGAPTLVRPRLGQAGFRWMVGSAYERRCAITGERTVPALEAAHIRPYAAGGPHDVENGLLLRADLHRLFDRGYITIDPSDRRLVVSPRVRKEFENGHDYYALSGTPLRQPAAPFQPASPDYLRYHAEHIYRF
jgi:putative restriction endonuclease